MQVARHWRLKRERYALVGTRCDACGATYFPARDHCRACGATVETALHFSGRGEVYSYTVVYYPPEGFEFFAPYVLALVRLEEGPLVTAQLTDVDAATVEIGMPVEMVTRKLKEEGDEGMIVYGYKFRPSFFAQLK